MANFQIDRDLLLMKLHYFFGIAGKDTNNVKYRKTDYIAVVEHKTKIRLSV